MSRLAIPELDLGVAIHDGWARFWYRDEMLPLSPDLQRNLDKVTEELRVTKEKLLQAEERERQAGELERQAEEREQSLLAQLRAMGVDPSR